MSTDRGVLDHGGTSPTVRRPDALVRILVVALVIALAAAGTFAALYVRGLSTSADEVGDFLDVRAAAAGNRARAIIDLLLNYDTATLDEVSQRMLELSTGNFKEQYQELIPDLGPALEKVAASSRGRALDGPEISFRSPAEAIAIARVEQTTQSRNDPGGRTIQYVLELTLVDTAGGGWKADRVEILSQTG